MQKIPKNIALSNMETEVLVHNVRLYKSNVSLERSKALLYIHYNLPIGYSLCKETYPVSDGNKLALRQNSI